MTTTNSFYRHLREWFTIFLPRQRGASPHTITACRDTWNMLLRYVVDTRQIPLEHVTFSLLDQACIIEFLDHMRTTRSWTAKTYNQRLACIRSFFRYASTAESTLAMHLVDVNAIPQLKSTAAPAINYLTTTAIAALLAAPDPATKTGLRDQFFMILMYDTAARDAEMLALTTGDLDAGRLTVDLIGKGSKPRRLPITAETATHYRRYAAVFHPDPASSQPLFYTIHGHHKTRMSDDNVARFLRQHAATARTSCAEIPDKVHPHMLRHSRAMHLYQAGMPLVLITEWLGHADPETTLIYAHADTEMKRLALAKTIDGSTTNPPAIPIWHGREDIIRQLCGLTT
ncbi:MAG TPA: tyrosine-type recombinase/integrase [Arthrobacter sp.]|nr:tyrosine-type recombinase/integrase [Arthrobacter sp.]